MSPNRRIPNVISFFASYLRDTDDYLQQVIEPDPPVFHNWKRLGLSEESATEWHDRRLYWENQLHPLYSNVLTKTKAVNAEVNSFMKAFIAFGSPLLNIMASSYAVTDNDALMFRFKIGRKKRSRHDVSITENCYPLIKSQGGAMFKVMCHTAGSNRAALPEGADSVVFAYSVGGTAPETPLDCQHTMIVTRARFVHSVGIEFLANYLYAFARWNNTRHPDLAGPWSTRAMVVLG